MDVPEIKFCGLTRAEDAAIAGELDAGYAGTIFASGPRLLDAVRANGVFAALAGTRAKRVGVFGAQTVEVMLRIADEVRLDVLQLHDGGTPDALLSLRGRFGGAIWVVSRVTDGTVGPLADAVLEVADAVVLDTAIGGRSGGTGVAFDWGAAAPAVRAVAARRPVVLAGGLRPSNVGEAVRRLSPRVVDVSSGVESAPGIKDHGLMRAFAAAARSREG